MDTQTLKSPNPRVPGPDFIDEAWDDLLDQIETFVNEKKCIERFSSFDDKGKWIERNPQKVADNLKAAPLRRGAMLAKILAAYADHGLSIATDQAIGAVKGEFRKKLGQSET